MGSPMAPTYANIFMAMLERKLLNQAPQDLIPIEWIRFIDDIFAIWTHGLDKLKTFLTYMNNMHPTIEFDYTYSEKSVNFLYITIYINSTGKLESDLYIRHTDRTLLLHQNSFHPQSCKNAIIYSQALRYRRTITENQKLEQRLNHLLITLIHRGYKDDTITTAFNKALCYTQNELLHKNKIKETKNNPVFSIQFNDNTKYITQILRKHWHIIEQDPTLRILWPEQPIVAYQKNNNLRDKLVNAILTKNKQTTLYHVTTPAPKTYTTPTNLFVKPMIPPAYHSKNNKSSIKIPQPPKQHNTRNDNRELMVSMKKRQHQQYSN